MPLRHGHGFGVGLGGQCCGDGRRGVWLLRLTGVCTPAADARWLVTPNDASQLGDLSRWQKVYQGRAWSLWQQSANPSVAQSTKPGEDKGLSCLDHHGQKQHQQ